MDRIQEMQYHNLRENFYDVVDNVLGKDYYNERADVYVVDAFSCRDIIREFNSVKNEMIVWKTGFWLSLILWIVTSIFY